MKLVMKPNIATWIRASFQGGWAIGSPCIAIRNIITRCIAPDNTDQITPVTSQISAGPDLLAEYRITPYKVQVKTNIAINNKIPATIRNKPAIGNVYRLCPVNRNNNPNITSHMLSCCGTGYWIGLLKIRGTTWYASPITNKPAHPKIWMIPCDCEWVSHVRLRSIPSNGIINIAAPVENPNTTAIITELRINGRYSLCVDQLSVVIPRVWGEWFDDGTVRHEGSVSLINLDIGTDTGNYLPNTIWTYSK